MLTKQAITKKLNVPSDKVWDAISKIGRLDVWFPFIETCKVEGNGPGALRYMTIADGGGEIKDTMKEYRKRNVSGAAYDDPRVAVAVGRFDEVVAIAEA
ncbi:SRPBCC family protein [Methylobacter sp.]